MSGALDYAVFGLRVRSEFMLPELFEAERSGRADVTIRRAPLRKAVTPFELERDGDALLLSIPDVATYRIAAGSEILVDAEPGVPERNVRLYLLGSAFGALLHQRGLLPLHANAVEIAGKAVAFMGESGAGKSTLAAWFHDRGYRVLADDVCVVRWDENANPRAYPGLPRIRLWSDALKSMGRTVEGLNRSYDGSSTVDKYDLPVPRRLTVSSDLLLRAACVLKEAQQFEINRLSGVAAAEAIIANTYRGSYVAAAKVQRQHWKSAVQLARSIPVYSIGRSKRFDRFLDENSRLLEHLAMVTAQSE